MKIFQTKLWTYKQDEKEEEEGGLIAKYLCFTTESQYLMEERDFRKTQILCFNGKSLRRIFVCVWPEANLFINIVACLNW